MSFDPFEGDGQRFPLNGDREPIVLRAEGMDHPAFSRSRRRVSTPYAEITHIAASPHAAWIGTKRNVYVLGRGAFAQTGGPENLVRALYRRIAAQPTGAAQLARMNEIDCASRAAGPLRATWGLAALCVAVFLAQLLWGDDVEVVGYFASYFFYDGDLWRLLTGNLIHVAPHFPLHLVLNMLGLFIFGAIVERPLGTARTLTVMGVSGVAAMLATALVTDVSVRGSSGVVFGLFGSALWLEFRRADRLPAYWRYPRRLLLWVLALDATFSFLSPSISGSAHLGGFLGGMGATALSTRGDRGFGIAPRWARAAGGCVVALTALSIWSAGWELSRPGEFAARQAARLAELPGVSPLALNELAWTIAISPESSHELFEAALVLAERAVTETDRFDPNILDTLAEVQFALGRREDAVHTIDEAIAWAPEEPYFREQRRRFTGERDPDDRPSPPLQLWLPSPSSPSQPHSEEPGLTV